MTIDAIYSFLLDLMRKNQAGGLSPSEFGNFWNGRQSSYLGDLVGRFQAHSNGKSGANTGLIENQTILTKLSPFIKSVPVTITAGAGTKPADLIYRLALRINNAKVVVVSRDKLWSVYDDVIDPPSEATNTYYASEIGGNYLFAPTTPTTATLDYISMPPDVNWGFTVDPITFQSVYDPTTSTQSLWDDVSNREITQGVLKSLGVAFHDRDFEQFGNSIIQTGN